MQEPQRIARVGDLLEYIEVAVEWLRAAPLDSADKLRWEGVLDQIDGLCKHLKAVGVDDTSLPIPEALKAAGALSTKVGEGC